MIGGQESYCYLGGERHLCKCTTNGRRGLSMEIWDTCAECKSRGCDERRRRTRTVTKMLPGRNPHGLFPGNIEGVH